MRLLGYSERGLVNALFHEIAASADADRLFGNLISKAVFPFTATGPPIGAVEILIEQSFSDFGDSDALALIGVDGIPRSAVFFEAKVKTYHVSEWRIADEFEMFRLGLERLVNSSNLFCQLYFKTRLVNGLKSGGVAALTAGLDFAHWSSKQNRRIGTNGVVLRATRKLEPFIAEPFYLAVIPDSRSRVEKFFETTLKPWSHLAVPDWEAARIGFLTWQDVRAYCEAEHLVRTLDTFEFNDRQIFAGETLPLP